MFKDVKIRVKRRGPASSWSRQLHTDMGLTGNVTINEQKLQHHAVADELETSVRPRVRGDGQELRIELALGHPVQRYSVTWREPFLLDTPFG